MKKTVSILLIAMLAMGLLAGCGGNDTPPANNQAQQPAAGDAAAKDDADKELVKLIVGATPSPHAEILYAVEEALEAEGYDLEVVEFNDYVLPNKSLDSGDLDANYFQHYPYLENFNTENGTALVSAAAIHYEPMGLYPGKTATIEELPDGATIAVPNDASNEARALLLLEAQGILKIDPAASLNATAMDITENPKNIELVETDAASLPRILPDVDMAVINGNYALPAGLNALTDSLAMEEKDSEAATTFANIIAVREGEESSEKIQALVKALTSDEVKAFMEEKYQGAVVPMF